MGVQYNHYDTLGIGRNAGFKEIKKAYFRQVKLCHPDLFGGSREKEEQFKLLVHAFDMLSDPDKRRRYDISIGASVETPADFTYDDESIMDSVADDTLEEIIVGNEAPEDSTLATLFLDLERTEVFISFREGKNYYRQGQYQNAFHYFRMASEHSPNNILYRYYLAKTLMQFRNYSEARKQFNLGIEIATGRIPPQRLQRFRDELDDIAEKQNPRLKTLMDFFGGKHMAREYVDSEEEAIRETNRAIARIVAERRKLSGSGRKLLK